MSPKKVFVFPNAAHVKRYQGPDSTGSQALTIYEGMTVEPMENGGHVVRFLAEAPLTHVVLHLQIEVTPRDPSCAVVSPRNGVRLVIPPIALVPPATLQSGQTSQTYNVEYRGQSPALTVLYQSLTGPCCPTNTALTSNLCDSFKCARVGVARFGTPPQ
jgi:hypothetical protein